MVIGEWRVSEWLLFNANSAIFQLYHGKNKLIFIPLSNITLIQSQPVFALSP
jgi:hypothetical protein